MNKWILLGIAVFLLVGISATPKWSAEQEHAIDLGREFLDDIGFQAGKALSIGLTDEVPAGYLYYWHSARRLERPDVQELGQCWLIRFEQGPRPGHWWEVLIDANTNEVVGGMSCR